MKNLWLYTEERPRAEVIKQIVGKFAEDREQKVSFNKIKIIPLMKEGLFTFVYKVKGVKCDDVKDILIETVSGNSSFVDYIIFHQENKPKTSDKPIYLIEETKTDDKESRNTGVYQRCSKFVYAEFFYPKVPKIMLYSLKITQKEKPTLTYIFGTKMLLTLGVQIMGKNLDSKIFKKFKNIDELIEEKNKMPETKNGVSVKITKKGNVIEITAKLEKSGKLTHDPNIGMTTIIASTLRVLGWKGSIIITKHGLPNQQSVGQKNKFNYIASELNIELDKLKVPKVDLPENYWKTEKDQEKLGTIFASILCEEFGDGISIYENHGGCERGYFIDVNNKITEYIVIPKYTNRQKYKDGDKSFIINIPDLVIYDKKRNLIIDGEGKKYKNKKQGLKELKNLLFFEENYIRIHYPDSGIIRSLVLYGGKENKFTGKHAGLLLNANGKIILGKNSPEIFKESLDRLLSI